MSDKIYLRGLIALLKQTEEKLNKEIDMHQAMYENENKRWHFTIEILMRALPRKEVKNLIEEASKKDEWYALSESDIEDIIEYVDLWFE